MLQINLSFRQLLLKYTPLLHERILKKIDNAISLRQQLLEEERLLPTDPARLQQIDNLSTIIASESNDFSAQIKYLLRLYSARRFFALKQGHLQQIPTSVDALWQFILAAVTLFYIEVTTFPLIWWESMRMSLSDLWGYILAGLLVIIPIYFLLINNPPQITSLPVFGGNVGLMYNYQVTATDPDGDPLKFKLIQAPAFLSIDSIGGMISGLPTISDTFTIKILVEDYKGAWDDQSYTFFVNP